LKQIFLRNLLRVKPPKRFSAGKSANCYSGAGGRDAGGASAPPKVLICPKFWQNPWKFGQSFWKSG